MSGIKLLLCEKDISYTNALVGYLISSRIGQDLSVTTYHDPERLKGEEGFFNIGIFGEEFLDVDVKCHLQRRFVLSEEKENEEKSEYIFKYRDMDNFMGKVFKTSSKSEGGQEIIVVYSPVFHELRLPFSLSLCKMFSEAGEVLFVDAGQVSILNHFMGKKPKRDLLDYLYIMESKNGNAELKDFLDYCEGFSVLPPMSSPIELSEINEKQWKSLINNIKNEGFDKLVLLVDSMLRGMVEIFEECDKIVLLGKPGGFDASGMDIFQEFMEKRGFSKKINRIVLPMSAGSDTGYTPESIFQGNMMEFVRKNGSFR